MHGMPLLQMGAIVSVASSNDEDHPASNVIDGNDQTFWMTTGLFPQIMVITFPQTVEIKSINLTGFGIRNIVIEKSSKSNPVDFEMIIEQSVKGDDDRIQSLNMPLSSSPDARHVKFIITEAYDSFVAIQNIKMEIEKRTR